jgi:hypothetical protein
MSFDYHYSLTIGFLLQTSLRIVTHPIPTTEAMGTDMVEAETVDTTEVVVVVAAATGVEAEAAGVAVVETLAEADTAAMMATGTEEAMGADTTIPAWLAQTRLTLPPIYQ